jgi:RNA polymerase sigma-70 factor (ECF subfamily)
VPSSPATDGEAFTTVLAAAQAGDSWAFELLYRELAPTVAGYFRVQGAVEPDDLTSEVFIGVFRALALFTGSEAEFRSFVFTVAHRRLTDERRRIARQPARVEILDDGGPVAGGDVEDDAFVRLGTSWVCELCARLVVDQRDVLLLRLVAGLTVEQVASTIGRSVGATKALQRRGLVALRRELEREGVPL